MKKWALYLFLVIAAAGSFIPCCRIDDCCADNPISHKEDQQSDEGACSPFFACATCPGFTARTKTVLTFPLLTPAPVHHERPFLFTVASYSKSFWQPPWPCQAFLIFFK